MRAARAEILIHETTPDKAALQPAIDTMLITSDARQECLLAETRPDTGYPLAKSNSLSHGC